MQNQDATLLQQYLTEIANQKPNWQKLIAIIKQVSDDQDISYGYTYKTPFESLFRPKNEDYHNPISDWAKHPLFWLAEHVDDSPDCANFIDLVLYKFEGHFDTKEDTFGDSPFLWAVSRVTPNNMPVAKEYISTLVGTSTALYNPMHGCMAYVNKLIPFMQADQYFDSFLERANDKHPNTPLMMAIKNGNIPLAIKLVKYYSVEGLLKKNDADNSALHLASFFRLDDVIQAIVYRAKELLGAEAVLLVRNGNGYSAADCYNAELPDDAKITRLYQGADAFSDGTTLLRFNQSTLGLKDFCNERMKRLILASEMIRFTSGQEGAHPYCKLPRGPLDPAIKGLLLSHGAQLQPVNFDHQTALSQTRTLAMTPASQQASAKPMMRFHINNNSSHQQKMKVTDSELDRICNAFANQFKSMNDCYIYEAYRGGDVNNIQLLYVHGYVDPRPSTNYCIVVYQVDLTNSSVIALHIAERDGNYHWNDGWDYKIKNQICTKLIELDPSTITSNNVAPPVTADDTYSIEESSSEEVDPGVKSDDEQEQAQKQKQAQEQAQQLNPASPQLGNHTTVPSAQPVDHTEENLQRKAALDKKLADNKRFFAVAVVLGILVTFILPVIGHYLVYYAYKHGKHDVNRLDVNVASYNLYRFGKGSDIMSDEYVTKRLKEKTPLKEKSNTARKIVALKPASQDKEKTKLSFFYANKQKLQAAKEKYQQHDQQNPNRPPLLVR